MFNDENYIRDVQGTRGGGTRGSQKKVSIYLVLVQRCNVKHLS